jgi:hypothetical protein
VDNLFNKVLKILVDQLTFQIENLGTPMQTVVIFGSSTCAIISFAIEEIIYYKELLVIIAKP